MCASHSLVYAEICPRNVTRVFLSEVCALCRRYNSARSAFEAIQTLNERFVLPGCTKPLQVQLSKHHLNI